MQNSFCKHHSNDDVGAQFAKDFLLKHDPTASDPNDASMFEYHSNGIERELLHKKAGTFPYKNLNVNS